MDSNFTVGQEVLGKVTRISDLGIHVRLDEFNSGLVYKAQFANTFRVGDKVKVFIKQIREDGKIDLELGKGGYKNYIDDSTNIVLEKLKEAGGFLPFHDKSTSQSIQLTFGISKKKFKEAIGSLYKLRRIVIDNRGIRLSK